MEILYMKQKQILSLLKWKGVTCEENVTVNLFSISEYITILTFSIH